MENFALMTSAADDIIGLYRRHAAAWAAARGEAFAEKVWIDRFAALLAPGAAVLDVGCGTGVPIARYLAAAGYQVIGVDSSPELIALFQTNLPEAVAHVADMRRLELGRTFGGLIAWDSFFHLNEADQRAMFPVFAGHAAPGAPLLFTSGPEAGEAIGSFEGEPLFHSSLDPDEYRHLLDRHGFDVIAHVSEDPDCGRHTVWLAQQRSG